MEKCIAYIFQTLFQHEVFLITPTLNAGFRCFRHVLVMVTNAIIGILIFLYKTAKIN